MKEETMAQETATTETAPKAMVVCDHGSYQLTTTGVNLTEETAPPPDAPKK